MPFYRRLSSLPKPPLPRNSLIIISTLIIANAIIWFAIALPILHLHPKLVSPAVLSYTLGLRHALDADHIAAIDLTTRRLIAAGQRPATVGTWFSLGHSTIVIITCVVVAATSGALRERFDGFAKVGNIVGTSVSAAFLIILCIGNGWVLYKLIKQLQETLHDDQRFAEHDENAAERMAAGQLQAEGGGFMTRVLRKLFLAIDRPWKMYPLGVVFGLGFDTSSEIAILGIASIHAVQGTSIWLILIFPILFTGMSHPSFPLSWASCSDSHSWHVSPRHHRRRSNDGTLHLKSLLSRHGCHSLLLNCPHRHHRPCLRFHRPCPALLAHPKRSRAGGTLLGWYFSHR